MSKTALELAQRQHGQHIYAYCNVRTNQVLYSLERRINSSHLKQLPDIGANYTPPSIRRDLWRPFWSVTLPRTPGGRAQGLHAFKKLREWRKLHETCWEPSAQLSRPYTEMEIKEMQEKLDNRGGSKVETVYEIIKREKHKMKARAVMDQKANSVADLAAVLLEQEDLGSKSAAPRKEKAEKAREQEIQKILDLARYANNGGEEELAKQIKKAQKTLTQAKDGRVVPIQKLIHRLRRKLESIKFASDQVALGREAAYWKSLTELAKDEEATQNREARLKELKVKLKKEPTASKEKADVGEPMSDEMKAEAEKEQEVRNEQVQELSRLEKDEKNLLFIAKQQQSGLSPAQLAVAARKNGLKANIDVNSEDFSPELLADFDPFNNDSHKLRKRSPIRQEVKAINAPVFTTQGVTVRWADVLDAEFAETWPADVTHERLEFDRSYKYTHRLPEEKSEVESGLAVADKAEALANATQLASTGDATIMQKRTHRRRKAMEKSERRRVMLQQMRDDILDTIRSGKQNYSRKVDYELQRAKDRTEAARRAVQMSKAGTSVVDAISAIDVPQAPKGEIRERATSM